MSYILDALRRADAERDRGAIPGLHAHTTSAEDGFQRARPWWGQPWAWVGAGVCGGLLVAGLVSWLVAADPPSAAVVAPPPASVPPPSPQAQTTAVAPAAPAAPAGPAAVPVAPPPVAIAPTAPPAPVYNAPPLDSRKPAGSGSGNASGAGNAPPANPPARSGDTARGMESPAAATSTDNGRTYALSELPDDIRRQLPALSIGGSSYSETPANRLLILNGQVFREGDRINADMVLEQIQLKSAVLRFKGYRYSVSY